MRELAARAYFASSRGLGRILRAGRYSTVWPATDTEVRKQRRFYAPLLVAFGHPLTRLLKTGMRVLPQRAWQERERMLYDRLYGTSVRVGADGALTLPRLHGHTLSALLENRRLDALQRRKAVELAAVALADFHRPGNSHGDAMAENVMVDVDAGVARWFDFETEHDADRPVAWRRADDVRALLATTLLRTRHDELAVTLNAILDSYGDEEVTRLVAGEFSSVWRRRLPFHLGQAGLSYGTFREIGRLLDERAG